MSERPEYGGGCAEWARYNGLEPDFMCCLSCHEDDDWMEVEDGERYWHVCCVAFNYVERVKAAGPTPREGT